MTARTIKIHDTGKGRKSVPDDLQAVLKKVEGWHQGTIAGYSISYRDTQGAWHKISWDGMEATLSEIAVGRSLTRSVMIRYEPQQI